MVDVKSMYESMAETGHAPADGCSLFGVLYDDAFERLRRKYIIDRFARGDSAEKFIVGPFGCGKTHFLRQLMEMGRSEGCVTVEIPLNKRLDFVRTLAVYRALTGQVRPPGEDSHGMAVLVRACLRNVRTGGGVDPSLGEQLASAWIAGLENSDFVLEPFARIVRKTFEAEVTEDRATFDAGTRWLAGDIDNRDIAKELGTSVVTRAEQDLFASQALLCLFQLVRHAGFRGTIVGYDEAEQGLDVDKKTRAEILSILQSDINDLATLSNGSALVVYAITGDLREKMSEFPALQQRVKDPFEGMGFFDGNTLAPTIDLTRRQAPPEEELQRIGHRLVEVFVDEVDGGGALDREELIRRSDAIGAELASTEASVSNRRSMVKACCAVLIQHLEAVSG